MTLPPCRTTVAYSYLWHQIQVKFVIPNTYLKYNLTHCHAVPDIFTWICYIMLVDTFIKRSSTGLVLLLYSLSIKTSIGWRIWKSNFQGEDVTQILPYLTLTVQTVKYLVQKANTMPTDALAPWVTRSSADMILVIQYWQIFIFFNSEFQQPSWF